MPDVLVSCFSMGLLLCSSSLRREEDVEKLHAVHAAQDGDTPVVEADT